MASLVTVFSGKGGTGKSFVASNLACGFTILGLRTLLIDFAFGVRNDDAILGLTDSVLYNIGDVVCGECTPDEAVIRSDKAYIPDFLASSVDVLNPESDLKKSAKKIIKAISREYDYIIFDCTCCAGQEFDVCCSFSDILIAVTGEDSFSVGNTALRLIRMADSLPDRKYLVINRAVITNDENDVSAEDIMDETGLMLAGIVPEDSYAMPSMVNSDPLVRYNTPAGVALENICRRINGEKIPFKTFKKQKNIFEKNKLTLKIQQGGY